MHECVIPSHSGSCIRQQKWILQLFVTVNRSCFYTLSIPSTTLLPPSTSLVLKSKISSREWRWCGEMAQEGNPWNLLKVACIKHWETGPVLLQFPHGCIFSTPAALGYLLACFLYFPTSLLHFTLTTSLHLQPVILPSYSTGILRLFCDINISS